MNVLSYLRRKLLRTGKSEPRSSVGLCQTCTRLPARRTMPLVGYTTLPSPSISPPIFSRLFQTSENSWWIHSSAQGQQSLLATGKDGQVLVWNLNQNIANLPSDK